MFREIIASASGANHDFVLVEIGHSGFTRYDYILVQRGMLRSSLNRARQRDITGTSLERRVSKFLADELSNLRGSAYSSMDDGDCYFLTARKGDLMHQLAVYADLKTDPVGTIIADLLAVARQE